MEYSGQSYKASTIVIYESRVVNISNLLVPKHSSRVVINTHGDFIRLSTIEATHQDMFPSTPDVPGEVGLKFALGLVTSCCGSKSTCLGLASGWGTDVPYDH